jgi:hypothetical protein
MNHRRDSWNGGSRQHEWKIFSKTSLSYIGAWCGDHIMVLFYTYMFKLITSYPTVPLCMQEHLSKRKMMAGRWEVSLLGIGTIEWTNLPTRGSGSEQPMWWWGEWYLDRVFTCVARWHAWGSCDDAWEKSKFFRQSSRALAGKMQHKSYFLWCEWHKLETHRWPG